MNKSKIKSVSCWLPISFCLNPEAKMRAAENALYWRCKKGAYNLCSSLWSLAKRKKDRYGR